MGLYNRRHKIAPRRSLRLVRGASLGRKPVPNFAEEVLTLPHTVENLVFDSSHAFKPSVCGIVRVQPPERVVQVL